MIKELQAHHARYGIPDIVLSNDAAQFTSEEFKILSQMNLITRCHPQDILKVIVREQQKQPKVLCGKQNRKLQIYLDLYGITEIHPDNA